MNDNIFSNFDDKFKDIKEILKREYKSDYLVDIYFDLFFEHKKLSARKIYDLLSFEREQIKERINEYFKCRAEQAKCEFKALNHPVNGWKNMFSRFLCGVNQASASLSSSATKWAINVLVEKSQKIEDELKACLADPLRYDKDVDDENKNYLAWYEKQEIKMIEYEK